MRRIAIFGLALALMGLLGAQQVQAAAPTFKQGCVVHGWFGNTPFDAITVATLQYQNATTGSVLSGKVVQNIGGAEVCTYTIVAGTGSVFLLNSDGTTAFTETWAPVAGNPAGCFTTNFVTHSQGVITTSGGYSVLTDVGDTGSGTCSLQ
jgi:hypothetical protein